MHQSLKKIILTVVFLLSVLLNLTTTRATNKINLSVDNIELRELVELLAKSLHRNIIVSQQVQGQASLSIENGSADAVLELLLLKYNLSKIQQGNIWFIAPREELIKFREGEAKLQQLHAENQLLKSKIWQLKYASAGRLLQILKDAKSNLTSSHGNLSMDARTNSILMYDDDARLILADKMIKKLDVPVPRVMITARIAAIDHDFEREFGLMLTQRMRVKDKAEYVANTSPGKFNLTIAKLANDSSLDVKLSALENAGHAELISRPSLFTENQQVASIEAGEEVPYQEVSESGGTATAFKKAVLSLKVKPQVLPGKKVLLQLRINQDRPTGRFVLGVPTISTRQLSTSMLLKSGETIALGGIYETDRENSEQGIPVLNKIPLLGRLFSLNKTVRNKRELCIFVTPTIMTPHEDEK